MKTLHSVSKALDGLGLVLVLVLGLFEIGLVGHRGMS